MSGMLFFNHENYWCYFGCVLFIKFKFYSRLIIHSLDVNAQTDKSIMSSIIQFTVSLPGSWFVNFRVKFERGLETF